VTTLLDPISLGDLSLPNRIIMAPMARARASLDNCPGDAMARYYAQRASAGLIIAEATAVSSVGRNYYRCPAIFTGKQRDGWRRVVDSVHDAGGRIFLQLNHSGRATHEETIGVIPVGPSAIATSTKTLTRDGFRACSMPRELSAEEIDAVVRDFAGASASAWEVGFDGVEIHAANGYLIDQFLKRSSNLRRDAYGGEVANRLRLLSAVVAAASSALPANRIGVRLAPGTAQDCGDPEAQVLFATVLTALADRDLAYVHMIEGVASGPTSLATVDTQQLRSLYPGRWIANNGYTFDLAERCVADGNADMIAFGRAFVANPDLVERLANGWPLAAVDKDTVFTHGEVGYTDYPVYSA
jgi:N-ethylmaleimide reductase